MKKIMSFILSLAFVICFGGCGKESASVGIIGGADGPTAILVTSNISWLDICVFGGVIVIAISVALFIYRNKKNK